tara:strand:- start:1994 stop:2932 length:939 start_codon:yes stop_codon:yes gene_type:complete
MKKSVILLFILILSTLTLAQEDIELSEDRLDLKFSSFGGTIDIDLKKYLGEGPYFVNGTKDVIIDIDQEVGKATLTPREGWEGAEIIVFRTKMKENLREVIVEKLQKAETEVVFDNFEDIFDSILDNLEVEQIKVIKSEFRDGEVLVDINNEIELLIGLDELKKPKFGLNILLNNEGLEIRKGFFEEINLKLISTIIVLAILLLIFKNRVIEFFIPLKDIKSTKARLLSKLKNLKHDDKKIVELVEFFFRRFINVNKKTTLYKLDLTLEKKGIKGHIKQEIVILFKRYQKGNYDKNDFKYLYSNLRRILVKL